MLITSFEAEAVWYEPEYAENRELPEDDRMAVLIEPMTHNEVKRAEESASTIRAGKRAKINFTKRHNEMRDKVMLRKVREVSGLSVQTRGSAGQVTGVVPITTAADLVAKAGDDLLNDIYEAMRDGSHLAEGVRGKSDLESDSPCVPKQASGNGTAKPAQSNSNTHADATSPTLTSTSSSPLNYNDAHGAS